MALSEGNTHLKQHIFYNERSEKDEENGIYEGYLDINRIKDLPHETGTYYFVCGPSVFIQKQFSDLKKLGIENKYIFFEEFGPQLLRLN